MSNAFTGSPLFGHLLSDEAAQLAFGAPNVLAKMLSFERAWSEALIATGKVSASDGAEAVRVIDGFEADVERIAEGADRDGLPLPALVKQLRDGQPDAVKAAIHTGATSQDVIDTAVILICRDLLGDFAKRAERCIAGLDNLSARFGESKMMGRTRMQAALPIQVADRMRTWRGPLQDHLNALPIMIENVARVQVGGPVGLQDRAMSAAVAKALDLNDAPTWHADRTPIVSLGHWLVLMTGTLGKIGADIALMAQQGVDEIVLDGAGGSSAMPHKQNPVRAEILVTLARYVAGQQGILGQAMVHEQERSGAAWTLEWMVLPAMFEATGASLNQAQDLLGQIKRIGPSA